MRLFVTLPVMLSAAAIAGPLTWDQLIKSAENEPRYQAAQKRADPTSSMQGTKLWDKMEFRYKLDGFSFAKHDFELRVTPKAFGEGSADREGYEASTGPLCRRAFADAVRPLRTRRALRASQEDS